MSNFEVFQCSVCSRKTEKLVDQTHASLNKCNITYKCTGNLIKLSQSYTKTMSGNSPAQSLVNWVPRGTNLTSASSIKNSQVSLNTAFDVLSIAIDNSQISGVNELIAKFEVKQLINSSFIEYFYSRSSNVSLISGQDDSSKRLTLKFNNGNNPDQIVVYVNGIELDSSVYDRSVPGRILLNTTLTAETNQVRVLVYQQTAPTYATLTFKKNTLDTILLGPISSWGNVNTINNSLTIFTCVDVSNLLINSRLSLISISKGNVQLSGNIGKWLLADSPFTSFDRNLLNDISISNMISNQDIIEYKNDIKNVPGFFIDGDVIESVFPPISITNKISADIDQKIVNDSNTQLTNAYIT